MKKQVKASVRLFFPHPLHSPSPSYLCCCPGWPLSSWIWAPLMTAILTEEMAEPWHSQSRSSAGIKGQLYLATERNSILCQRLTSPFWDLRKSSTLLPLSNCSVSTFQWWGATCTVQAVWCWEENTYYKLLYCVQFHPIQNGSKVQKGEKSSLSAKGHSRLWNVNVIYLTAVGVEFYFKICIHEKEGLIPILWIFKNSAKGMTSLTR